MAAKQALKGKRSALYASPKSRRWLRTLSPRGELIARMALRDDVREPGASRAWEARISAQADLIRTEEDWVALLPCGAPSQAGDRGRRLGARRGIS
jgi:hypothetical protein